MTCRLVRIAVVAVTPIIPAESSGIGPPVLLVSRNAAVSGDLDKEVKAMARRPRCDTPRCGTPWLVAAFAVGLCGGCATPNVVGPAPAVNRVWYGGDRPRLDRMERVVWAPVQWIAGPQPAPDSVAAAEERQAAVDVATKYLAEQDLTDVHVDVRAYEPAEQWRRIRTNESIHPVVRYPLGALSWVRYAALPGRVFRMNYYDPFANTLYVNSARNERVLYESMSARRYRTRPWLGGYCLLQRAPVAPIFHHRHVAREAVAYADAHMDPPTRRRMYSTAYGRVGSSVASSSLFFLPTVSDASPLSAPAARLVGGAAGRAAGRVAARRSDPVR